MLIYVTVGGPLTCLKSIPLAQEQLLGFGTSFHMSFLILQDDGL